MNRMLALLSFLCLLALSSRCNAQAQSTYKDIYAPILDSALDLIQHGPEAHILKNGEIGIAEALSGHAPSFTLEKIGYTIQDLTGDNTPELILAAINGWGGDVMIGRELYAVYTCQNGTPALLLDGWARNSYYLLCDGNILNSGSSGAAYPIFGTYALTQDGLKCLDYFFTSEKGESLEEIGIYHNCTGEWDITVSEEMDMSVDAFWRLYEDNEQQIVPLTLNPFTAYGMKKGTANSLIRARWASDLPAMPSDFTEYRDVSSEYQSEILFTSVGTVTNIHLLSLEFQDFDESGNPHFNFAIVHSKSTLDTPFLAAISFGEVLPIYGISYVDDHGVTHTCTLEISGKDGSVLMVEYT